MSVIKQAQAEGTLPDNSAYPQEKPFLLLSMFIIPQLSKLIGRSVTLCKKLVKTQIDLY